MKLLHLRRHSLKALRIRNARSFGEERCLDRRSGGTWRRYIFSTAKPGSLDLAHDLSARRSACLSRLLAGLVSFWTHPVLVGTVWE